MSLNEYTQEQDQKIRKFLFIAGAVLDEVKLLISEDISLQMALGDIFLKMGDFCVLMSKLSQDKECIKDEA